MTDADPTVLCPVCAQRAVPLVTLRHLIICGACGASVWGDGIASWHRATVEDVATLAPAELQALRQARGSLARVR